MCPRAVHRSTFLIFALLWLTVVLASPILQDAALQQKLESALKAADNLNRAEAEELKANPETPAGRADPPKGAHSLSRQTVPVEQKRPAEPAKGTFARGDYPAIERPRSEHNEGPASPPGQAQNNAAAEIKGPKEGASRPAGKPNEPSRIQLFDRPGAKAPPKKKEDRPEVVYVEMGRIQLFGRPHTANQQLLGS